jgi:hypothetical protein
LDLIAVWSWELGQQAGLAIVATETAGRGNKKSPLRAHFFSENDEREGIGSYNQEPWFAWFGDLSSQFSQRTRPAWFGLHLLGRRFDLVAVQ